MVHAVETLLDFELLREIGRGGMGVVHLARQRSLGRYVALKILPEEFTADPVRRARFHREAEAVSRLDHPSIVPVYAVGETGGVHFIAMKFLDGATLDHLIRARRPARPRDPKDPDTSPRTLVLAPDAVTKPAGHPEFDRRPPDPAAWPAESEAGWLSRSLRIAERVASALHHAHERGVIHRDVKPGNILLDCEGHPWLLDFGLVRDLRNESITKSDSFLGTAWYMAPEQVRKGDTEPDHRVDIYSLGVTLFELFTLRRPFEYRSPETLFHAIVHEEPPAPRVFAPRIPRDLETIILKAMAKDPAERYATAAELAEDLRRVREHEPIAARPVGSLGRGRRWVRRNPALAAAFLVAAVCLVGFVQASVYRDALERRRMLSALEAADAAFESGEWARAQTHYHFFIILGGDKDVVAPRLRVAREHLIENSRRGDGKSGHR